MRRSPCQRCIFGYDAISVIEKQRGTGKPLMLYLSYTAPHMPWLPSPAFAGESGAGLYGDFLMMVDHEIGRVRTALAGHGRRRVRLRSND